jgi:hypothetical protein
MHQTVLDHDASQLVNLSVRNELETIRRLISRHSIPRVSFRGLITATKLRVITATSIDVTVFPNALRPALRAFGKKVNKLTSNWVAGRNPQIGGRF